jgi:hypothetical protein
MDSAKPKQMGKLKERVKEMAKPRARRWGTRKSSVRSFLGLLMEWVLW